MSVADVAAFCQSPGIGIHMHVPVFSDDSVLDICHRVGWGLLWGPRHLGVTGDCTRSAKFGELSSSCVDSTQDPLSPILYEVALVTVLRFVSIRRRYLIGTKCTITTSRQDFSILNLFKSF